MQKTSVSCCTQFRMNTDVLSSYFWCFHWLLVFYFVISLLFSIKLSISNNMIVLHCIYLFLWMSLRIYKSTLLCYSGMKCTDVRILHILNEQCTCLFHVCLPIWKKDGWAFLVVCLYYLFWFQCGYSLSVKSCEPNWKLWKYLWLHEMWRRNNTHVFSFCIHIHTFICVIL